MASERERADGEFQCVACETAMRLARADYDRLGYAVCPACGESDSPLAEQA